MENSNDFSQPSADTDLLGEELFDQDHLVYATQGQRFLNWLIDNLLMRFGLSYLTGMGIGFILAFTAPDFLESATTGSALIVLSFMVGYLNYIVYYTICEKLFKGYTLGKVITGTRAIRQDGTELSFKDALLRSLSRCVPFEVFSGFSTLTWHDSWTDTMVVKAR